MRRAAILLAALAVLVAPPAAAAQDCPKTTLGDIEDEVMCPICGTPLAVATDAPQAQQEREFIEQQIADCRSKDQIKRALVAQFGEGVLALPGDDSGDEDLGDVLIYVIPALALLLALAAIGLTVLRWRGRRPRHPASAAGGADSGRLDADMERYDL